MTRLMFRSTPREGIDFLKAEINNKSDSGKTFTSLIMKRINLPDDERIPRTKTLHDSFSSSYMKWGCYDISIAQCCLEMKRCR